MKRHIKAKLRQAQDELGLYLPEKIFDFIAKLDKADVKFGSETWSFCSVNDKPKDSSDNYIIDRSVNFSNEWSLDGIIFADNGIGDYLLVLPYECGERILVTMHEIAELRLFSNNIDELSKTGPENYVVSDNYLFKLDEDNNLIRGEIPSEGGSSREYFGDDYQLRSYLDNLIDDQKTEKITDIVIGLEELIENADEKHKVWALNKLSDIYLKGFGAMPPDMTKALDYNQKAIDLNSHQALANRAACYFFGLGMSKDVAKALSLAT
ncbi:MAG: hypothetical protein O9262_01000, partial [Cyclobacteriaceae bacterium]|nr:hypothetical protein [Cyclobacteriaceae bacterium]